jgi:predicted dehydrogenase
MGPGTIHPKAYGSYEALLEDKEIDAVYIPIPTGIRKDWVLQAAAQGKHVLCEKPVAGNLIETQEMVQACRDAGVVFMDGVMFMHSPRLPALKAELDGDDFGELRRICMDFGFPGDQSFFGENIRVDPMLEPLGCLGDLGWYNARFALWAFDYQMPLKVSALVHKSVDGVPIDISCMLHFGSGKSASWTNSFETSFRQYAALVGTKQSIELDDFVLSGQAASHCEYTLTMEHGLTDMDLLVQKQQELKTVAHPRGANQEVHMWETFAQLASDGAGTKEARWWGDVSIATQAVMDACVASDAQGGKAVAPAHVEWTA